LPPASVSPWLARWRWPRWKFGTVSVRSSPAFNVTVTIMGRSPEPRSDVRKRAAAVEAELAEEPGACYRARSHERPTRDERATGEHPHFPEPVPAMHRH